MQITPLHFMNKNTGKMAQNKEKRLQIKTIRKRFLAEKEGFEL